MAGSFGNNFSNGRGGLARIVSASNAPQVGLAAVILFLFPTSFLIDSALKGRNFKWILLGPFEKLFSKLSLIAEMKKK